ncbi:hypothetical protein HU200_043287 [Digitaria exilis]|uniref:Bifunctional inhibitor/plant lipid transfer protein/seed storage helical domain-containing protein n=1 Tax=Digitaria exilis TaxID=1010633 RepID=A0A835EGF8_9POAL|nr:hypothetical protein HU200_043287 [Digitaria exilis]
MQTRLARLLAVVIALAAAATPSHAQGTAGAGAMPSCAAKLVRCAAYLNSTSGTPPPPATCCDPLKEAAANETAALQAFGVAPEQGIGLAKRCGVTTDASVCDKSAAAASGAGNSDCSSSHSDDRPRLNVL